MDALERENKLLYGRLEGRKATTSITQYNAFQLYKLQLYSLRLSSLRLSSVQAVQAARALQVTHRFVLNP